MKLKLFKPNFLNDRKGNQLNNSIIFAELMKRNSRRDDFNDKQGKGNTNLLLNNIKLNKHESLIDVFEHKLQIESIFKRYNQTIKRRSNKDTTQLSLNYSQKKKVGYKNSTNNDSNIKHMDKTSNVILTQLLQVQGNDISNNTSLSHFPINSPLKHSLTPNYQRIKKIKIKTKAIPRMNNTAMSLLRNQSYRVSRKAQDSSCNNTNIVCNDVSLPIVKLHHIKKMDNIFIDNFDDDDEDNEKDYYHYDRNVLFEKLKKQNMFYASNENSFDKSKWRLFKQRLNIYNQLLPKHSLHYIKTMQRKEVLQC